MQIVPKDIEKFLKRYAGVNPFGKPKWRLIAACDRMVKEAGVWQDWAPGLTSAEKGGFNFTECAEGMHFEAHQNKPIRVVTEMREHRKYPSSEGWILEKWFPAHKYGSREDWESYVASDGRTPMLGPYPECGDYEFLHGPWLHTPSLDVLEKYISMYTDAQANKKGTPESRAREYAQRCQEQEEIAEAKKMQEYEEAFRDKLTPMNSTSLAASRWRNQVARDAGIRSHIGLESAR